LLPRVRFAGEFGHGRTQILIGNIWFLSKIDLRRQDFTLRILFIKIHSKKKQKRPLRSELRVSTHPDKSKAPPRVPKYSEPLDMPPGEESEDTVKPSAGPRGKGFRKPHVRFGRHGKRDRKKEKNGSGKIPGALLWRERALIITVVRRLINSLARLMKHPRFDRLRAEIDIATPDPSLTGILYGAARQLTAFHKPPRRVIIVRFDFDEDTPGLDVSCRLSVSPVVVVFESLYMIVRMPWLRILKVYLDLRKQRKQVASRDD